MMCEVPRGPMLFSRPIPDSKFSLPLDLDLMFELRTSQLCVFKLSSPKDTFVRNGTGPAFPTAH